MGSRESYLIKFIVEAHCIAFFVFTYFLIYPTSRAFAYSAFPDSWKSNWARLAFSLLVLIFYVYVGISFLFPVLFQYSQIFTIVYWLGTDIRVLTSKLALDELFHMYRQFEL